VPKKVEQINDYLFIDTYKSNKIKIGMNETRVSKRRRKVRRGRSTIDKLGSMRVY
jgi:hypothetical protein